MTQAAVQINSAPPMEVWKPVEGFHPYEVSSFGRVRGFGGKILRPRHHTNGYCRVSLCKNAKRHDAYIHRLVCSAFYGLPAADEHADHINKDRSDNRAENLRWATPQANRASRIVCAGTGHHNAKLNPAAVAVIRAAAHCRGSDSAHAKAFGVSREAVRDARLGRAWRTNNVAL